MLENEISIIIPLYNREIHISETLASVFRQTSKKFRCIIIDDHSTDNSFQIASNYIKDDNRFLLKKRTSLKKGAPVCRNEGIDLTSSKYLMFLDSDDLMDPFCVEQRLQMIHENSNKDFYVFKVALFNDDNYIAKYLCADITAKNDIHSFLNYTGGWHTSSTVFNSAFIKDQLYFDEDALSWQDVEFHIRALLMYPNYIKFHYSFPDVYVRISNIDRISNSKWSYQKISSRIDIYLKIENEIKIKREENFKLNFFFFYFRYLEIGARTLNNSKYQKLIEMWQSRYSYWDNSSYWMLKYLNFQNFLARNNFKLTSAISHKLVILFLPNRLLHPQKKIKLFPEINIKNRLLLNNSKNL